ncbi:hypothetical protein CROQUDRAFT_96245 [Cronartium quercuum f. sp. fusiforme G11]|uniref:Uncharacterized protein n=1 Tax=Cronartium quercuum f. sp. fusiforme G11 TaxID=708437 RepID=A0A9P6ND98_9BASI|nr:hypothetical protein CROQUDRAFT_96245 [Cronartium quercuum f. sp. fusiforme G11]
MVFPNVDELPEPCLCICKEPILLLVNACPHSTLRHSVAARTSETGRCDSREIWRQEKLASIGTAGLNYPSGPTRQSHQVFKRSTSIICTEFSEPTQSIPQEFTISCYIARNNLTKFEVEQSSSYYHRAFE